MLSLSKKTDYALLILCELASAPGEFLPLRALAERRRLPFRFLAQIARLLLKRGLIVSREGANGGYRLKKDPRKITVSEVIFAVEGGVALSECLKEINNCGVSASCPLRGSMPEVQKMVLKTLEKKTVASLVKKSLA